MSDKLKIETGIPVPPKASNKNKELYDTLALLKPGESVLVPVDYVEGKSDFATLVYSWARSAGLKGQFVTRKVDGGRRVWRL